MSNFVPILAGLLISVWSPLVLAQSAGDSWSLTGLTLRSVPVIWMRDGGDFVREIARDGKGFLELQGRLQMPAGARLDPIALAEIRLRPADSTQGASAQSAFAVGASIVMCRYLSREPLPRVPSIMIVGQAGGVAVARDAPGAPLKLIVEGGGANLCIAFAPAAKVSEKMLLEFAGRSFPVSLTASAKPLAEAKGNQGWELPGASLISRRALLIATALALLIVVLAAAAIIWRRRTRPMSLANTASAVVPAVDGAGPRRVSAVHCRTSFAPFGANVGPGKADFAAALRAFQGEQFSAADALLAQAIGKGLPATYECGAWSLRGQAALGLGQIELAIDSFLKAIEGPEVTVQAAMPAAAHLAVIYRALGFNADAKRMEVVTKAIIGLDCEIAPEMVKRIGELAREYRLALRAARPSALRRLVRGICKRSPSAAGD